MSDEVERVRLRILNTQGPPSWEHSQAEVSWGAVRALLAAYDEATALAGHTMAEREELRALLDARDDHTAEEVGYAAVLARAERAEAERDALRAAQEESE